MIRQISINKCNKSKAIINKNKSGVKHNDERNPYRRKSKTEMAADGRNECNLGLPYRETERLPGWLYEYSYRSGRRRTEESRIKRVGMTEMSGNRCVRCENGFHSASN